MIEWDRAVSDRPVPVLRSETVRGMSGFRASLEGEVGKGSYSISSKHQTRIKLGILNKGYSKGITP